ncbi:unnamed protein product [Protopolystoma xenopodis]|uniref:Uncharacterized protein n=1 Tax=Protopolystoma xenopodis TaxID=117903 RepID=A0A3S5CI80_9PLAT|nr:unnamed protein product [Protopolystoma xenopodis]
MPGQSSLLFSASASVADRLPLLLGRPGSKVRLRGPLNLRAGCILLPPGTFTRAVANYQNQSATLAAGQHSQPQARLVIMGGEVDEILSALQTSPVSVRLSSMLGSLSQPVGEATINSTYLLTKLLQTKLRLPADSYPEWFPLLGIRGWSTASDYCNLL